MCPPQAVVVVGHNTALAGLCIWHFDPVATHRFGLVRQLASELSLRRVPIYRTQGSIKRKLSI